MRKDVKKAWVKELRSGNHQQGTGALCARGEKCCIGVLGLVVERDFGGFLDETGTRFIGDWQDNIQSAEWFDEDTVHKDGSLPEVLWRALEIHKPQSFYYGLNDDKRLAFTEIADIIEETE